MSRRSMRRPRYDVLFRDMFHVNAASPLLSPRSGEPSGPGLATLIQNDGAFSVVSQHLSWPAQATPVAGDLRYNVGPFTRAEGLYLWARKLSYSVGNQITVGWDDNILGQPAAGAISFSFLETTVTSADEFMTNMGFQNHSEDFDYLVMFTPTRFYAFIRGYYFSRWTLLWTGANSVVGNVWAALSTMDLAGVMDAFDVRRSNSAWPDHGLAIYADPTPTTGDEFYTHRNSLLRFTWVAGGGETLQLYFRRVDDDNTLIIRCSQAGGTIKLIKRELGVENEIVSAAQVWTPGNTYSLTLVADYTPTISDIYVFINGVGRKIASTSTYNADKSGMKVSGFANGANLYVYPRDCSDFINPLTLKTFNFLWIGDSKTSYPGHIDDFNDALNTQSQRFAASDWPEYNLGGATWNTYAGTIDASLALRTNKVDDIGINVGANDVLALPLEVTWKADVNYVLNAIHNKYPYSRIALMRPWRRNWNAQCNTLAGWIADVVAARPYCMLGPDERVFLENGDNGATYTADGTHPNAAGYAITAQEWQRVLGYE